MCGRRLCRRRVGRQQYSGGCPPGARGPAGTHSARHVPPNLYAPFHLDTDANDNTYPGTPHHDARATQPDVTARTHSGRRSANQRPIPNTHLYAPNANALAADTHPTAADAHPTAADAHPAATNCHASSSVDHL
jgi:hypothetical protein